MEAQTPTAISTEPNLRRIRWAYARIMFAATDIARGPEGVMVALAEELGNQ